MMGASIDVETAVLFTFQKKKNYNMLETICTLSVAS
jgi:hypothetical protein